MAEFPFRAAQVSIAGARAVPRVNASVMLAPLRAVAEIGQSIQNIGVQVRKSQRANAALDADAQIRNELTDLELEADQTRKPLEEMDQWLADKFQTIGDKAQQDHGFDDVTSNIISRAHERATNATRRNVLKRTIQREAQEGAAKVGGHLETLLRSGAVSESLVERTDNKASGSSAVELGVEAGYFLPEAGRRLLETFKRNMDIGVAEGWITDRPGEAAQLLRETERTPDIDEPTRQRLIRRAEGRAAQKNSSDATELRRMLRDEVNSLRIKDPTAHLTASTAADGTVIIPPIPPTAIEIAEASGLIPDAEMDRWRIRVGFSNQFREISKGMPVIANQNLAAYLEQFNPDKIGHTDDREINTQRILFAQLQTQAAQLLTARTNDPAQAVNDLGGALLSDMPTSTPAEFDAMLDKTLSRQDSLGIVGPAQRLLSKSVVAGMILTYKNGQKAEREGLMARINSSKYAARVLQELAASPKPPPVDIFFRNDMGVLGREVLDTIANTITADLRKPIADLATGIDQDILGRRSDYLDMIAPNQIFPNKSDASEMLTRLAYKFAQDGVKNPVGAAIDVLMEGKIRVGTVRAPDAPLMTLSIQRYIDRRFHNQEWMETRGHDTGQINTNIFPYKTLRPYTNADETGIALFDQDGFPVVDLSGKPIEATWADILSFGADNIPSLFEEFISSGLQKLKMEPKPKPGPTI